MKNLFIIVIVAIFYSCGSGTQKNETNKPEAGDVKSTSLTNNEHNSKNSINYKGTYKGLLPAASGEMNITLILEDSTYVKETTYSANDHKKVYEDRGKYTWNTEGNTIILDGLKDAPNQYFVGENTLTQLDMDGKKVTGEFADMYILKK